jgi:hypothetical protein
MVAAPEAAEADILIAPTVKAPGMSAVEEQQRATRAGYEAARAALRVGLPPLGKDVAMRPVRVDQRIPARDGDPQISRR